MKYSKLKYYLLATICFVATSCGITDVEMGDSPEPEMESVKVQLTLSLPADTRGGTSPEAVYEQYIKDIRLFVFQSGTYKEEVQNLFINGTDGDETRTITGILSNDYTGTVRIVALANLKARIIKTLELTAGTTTEADLYKQLAFTYDGGDSWKFANGNNSIPMWGVKEMTLTKGTVNNADLSLIRAIAKVNVTVNGGQGLDNFTLTKVEIKRINNKGYCAPLTEGTVNIPNDVGLLKNNLSFNITSGIFKLENQIYIPEQRNTGVSDESTVQLVITGTSSGTGENKEYILNFKDNNGSRCDVLRNNLYIFNIKSVNSTVDAGLTYEVEKWKSITVDIPPFN